jgi:hypothetical protein
MERLLGGITLEEFFHVKEIFLLGGFIACE